MLDLGTLGGTTSGADGINASGQVVGWARMPTQEAHAFLWEGPTGMLDINTLISPGSGWLLNFALGVNDNGLIAGRGIAPDGQTHGFLLTPVPEPSGLMALGMAGGLIWLVGLRRRSDCNR